MAGWGGARQGAGRKRKTAASPRRFVVARARRKARRIERITDARERARKWIEVFEPELLSNILAGDDDRLKVEVSGRKSKLENLIAARGR